MVGRMGGAAKLEEPLSGAERVAVEQYLLAAAAAPAHDWVLAPLAITAEIRKRPVGRWHGGIVLLDPSLHLGEQLRLKIGRVGEGGVRVGVLRLKVGTDLRVERGWIAHD